MRRIAHSKKELKISCGGFPVELIKENIQKRIPLFEITRHCPNTRARARVRIMSRINYAVLQHQSP